ncbi:endonuclease [Caerostris darwini]|uniref:Endonuclease n=1 Tax=Caerostris darwini TaxID=1538125 RepID=A0AAV4X3C9_9ARAC|nr:endonuclease [Caerostris darwini]
MLVGRFREAHHRSIQETPAFLVYGRDLQMPYDLIFRDQVRTYSDTPSFATQLVNRLQSSFALVKQHLEKSAEEVSKHQIKLVKVAVREIFPDVSLDEHTVNLSNSQKIDVTHENVDNEVLNQFPPFCRPYQNWGYPEEVLVRKDHSTGVGESPPQAVDDHSPPNSSTAQVAVSHRYNLRPRNAMGFVK